MDMKQEIKKELTGHIIPFWKSLRDDTYGGYYGFMDYDLKLDRRAVKGCILNSRILCFFSNAAMILKDEALLDEARHSYEFLVTRFLDTKHGGVYWSV
ncbi:MAG: N-acylglucosamine 2-epimerase, partial [Eubacterium sp.]|nr:N-acylglucosamine 2-epimerase [Eubacterium sp.]